jgi:hypothetical protein
LVGKKEASKDPQNSHGFSFLLAESREYFEYGDRDENELDEDELIRD